MILEESNIKKKKNKTQKLEQKNPNQLTLYRQARNKGEEGREDFKISIGFYSLLAASVFLTIWVHMKSASLPHLYVYEVTKIGKCTHKITRQLMCLTMFGDLMLVRGGLFFKTLLS